MRSALVTLDGNGRFTLPVNVRAALGVAPGDFIILEGSLRGAFELVPAALVPNDQLWFHHPKMQARIARAERKLVLGHSTRTKTPEEARLFLDSLKRRPKPRK